MKKIGRRGFIATAALFVGGLFCAKASGNQQQAFDKTTAVMLGNKLLSKLEDQAIYAIGGSKPLGFMYRYRDDQGQMQSMCLNNLDLDIRFHRTKDHGFESVAISFTPKSVNGQRCGSSVYTEVTLWNDESKLDTFRMQNIKDALRQHIQQNGNLHVHYSDELAKTRQESGVTFPSKKS